MEKELVGEAGRCKAEYRGRVPRVGIVGHDAQEPERGRLMLGESRARRDRRGPRSSRFGGEREPQLRELRPEAAPATRKDAGPRGGRGRREVEEDEEEDVVGERAEKVLLLPLAAAAFITGRCEIRG